ncbi:MAG: restriction endonuclease, partial [Sphingobacteriaceae bacterium]
MQQVDSFHYPPELFELLVSTIPLLNKSKKSVLLFFRGAGVAENLYKDLSDKLDVNKDSVHKYEISRIILTRINEKKDVYIRERRELLKRVVEFESFTNCWESDQLKAKGLVAEIRTIINVKDSFTRMNQEREKEHLKHTTEYNNIIKEIQKRAEQLEETKKNLYSLFNENNNPQERGKNLENVLNTLFSIYGILIREAFTRKGDNGEGIIEQIDGVIEIDNQIYLVEMKWKKDKIGSDDIFAHLGRIYHRTSAQGIFISASGYAPSGIKS